MLVSCYPCITGRNTDCVVGSQAWQCVAAAECVAEAQRGAEAVQDGVDGLGLTDSSMRPGTQQLSRLTFIVPEPRIPLQHPAARLHTVPLLPGPRDMLC